MRMLSLLLCVQSGTPSRRWNNIERKGTKNRFDRNDFISNSNECWWIALDRRASERERMEWEAKGQCDLSHAQPQISQNLVRWVSNCKWHHVAPLGRVGWHRALHGRLPWELATDNRKHDFYGYDSSRYNSPANLPANSMRLNGQIEWFYLFTEHVTFSLIKSTHFMGGEILFHRIGRTLLSKAFIITFYCCCSNSSIQ